MAMANPAHYAPNRGFLRSSMAVWTRAQRERILDVGYKYLMTCRAHPPMNLLVRDV